MNTVARGLGLILCAACAVLQPVRGEALDQLVESLAAALKPHVKTLARPVHTYHYAMRERIGLPASGPIPSSFSPRGYLDMKISRYWDLSLPVKPYATASGLYVATDPVISRGFGGMGTVWAMIEVVLDKGFRFIDVRRFEDQREDRQKFPPAMQSQLQAAGCDVQFPATLLIMLESKACRSLAVRVAASLQIDGILHDFQRKRLDPCPERPQGGFIVLDARAAPPDAVRVLIAESQAPERMRIQDMFRRARRAGSLIALPWPDDGRDAGVPDMDAWMHEHIFGCGGYSEDQMPAGDEPRAAQARSPQSLYESAQALSGAGKTGEAIEAYRAALGIDPDFVLAIDELAWILATSSDPAYRNPAEAEHLAGHLVELTHYKFRRTTLGMFAKTYKVHASHTLAAAFAANANFTRAVQYAMQSLETVRRLEEVEPSPTTAQLLVDAQMYVTLYESGHPFVAPPGFQRTPVSLH